MKKLQSYVLKDLFRAFIPAFCALMMIMVLGFCVKLLHEGLDVVRLRALVPYVSMYSLPMVLPASFLTAVIVVFGRLSADNEITAVQVGGVHLLRIILPVCAVALVLGVVAAYFQFQVVPRARRQMALLQFRALKQILIDKVALSSNRRFSFWPYEIHYEEFQQGKMKDLLVLKLQAGLPGTIISAASGSVEADPENQELVLFELEDCKITEFGDRVTTVIAQGVELKVWIPSGVDYRKNDAKHFGVKDLVAYRAELRRQVGSFPALRNPGELVSEATASITEARAEVDYYETEIKVRKKDYDSILSVDQRRLEQQIELANRDIEAAQGELEILRAQQRSSMDRIRTLREGQEREGAEEERQDRLAVLDSIKETIASRDREIKEALAGKERADEAMERNERKALELAGEIEGLEKLKDGKEAQLQELEEARRGARIQEDLRSIGVRIHKRLAQALAVLIFAMIGIPLGVMCRGRSPMVAFGISFAIVLFLFYPFLIAGQIAAQAGVLPVVPSIWAGNVLTLAIGCTLMARVLRQ